MTDYDNLPIDRLRWIAEHANQPSRSAARKALEARLLTAKPDAPATYQVLVSASEFGTPRPEIRVLVPGARNHRDLLGVLHDVAAGVERKLALTREAWEVGIRRVEEREGAVYLDLMDGHQAEVDRAVAVLNALVCPGAPVPARPRPRRERPPAARTHGEAAYAVDAAISAADAKAREFDAAEAAARDYAAVARDYAAAGGEPQPEAPPSAQTELAELIADATPAAAAEPEDAAAARAARREYRKAAGKAADRFQERRLKRDRAELPACAIAALDGGYRTAEYWTWLLNQYLATHANLPSKGAK